MFDFFKNLFRRKLKCGLCKEAFNAKNPDVICIRHSNGDFEDIDICPVCAAMLELHKDKDDSAPYSVERDS